MSPVFDSCWQNANMKWFFLLYLFFHMVIGKHEQYDGYVLYEVYPKNIEDMRLVNDVVDKLGLDIWSFATLSNPGEIFVSKPQREPFEKSLKDIGVAYKATIENIRELLEKEDQRLSAVPVTRNRNSTDLTFDHIYTYEEVIDYMEAMARKYPRLATLLEPGASFEGRPINILRISTTGFMPYWKPVIFLQSLLHAREWVTLPPTLYAIHKLLTDDKYYDLLNNIDWIIMPVANPDGYVWTHTEDRFWRKNRRTGLTPNDTCVGVDLNRNFDINWGTASSSNPCSLNFHGAGPTSEPETEAIVRLLRRQRVTMYEDLHSTGSMILYGWGNGTLVPNALIQHLAAVTMAQAIDKVKWESKPNYRVGNIVAVLGYTASGGGIDYATTMGIPYSHAYELPAYLGGVGVDRFLVDPDFVEQAAVETWEGISAGARHILRFPLTPRT